MGKTVIIWAYMRPGRRILYSCYQNHPLGAWKVSLQVFVGLTIRCRRNHIIPKHGYGLRESLGEGMMGEAIVWQGSILL